MYVSVTISHVLQQQGKYEDDFVPTESLLQALEVEGDFMMGFFTTVYVCVCMPHTCTIIYIYTYDMRKRDGDKPIGPFPVYYIVLRNNPGRGCVTTCIKF